MQDVNMKLNPELPWHKNLSTRSNIFQQKIGLIFKEETSKLLHIEHRFVWCWLLDTSGSRSKTLKFWNVVLEKDGENNFDRLCGKLRSIRKSQGGQKYPTNNKKKDG